MLDISLVIMGLVLTAIAVSLAGMVWGRSRRDYRRPFTLLMMSQLVILWGYTMEVASEAMDTKLLWNNIEYVGYAGAIASFFLFSVQYSRNVKTDRRLLAALGVPSILVVLAVVTNPMHHLFYLSTEVSSDYYLSFHADYGPFFYAYLAYAAVILLAGIIYLAITLVRTSNAHRTRVGITCLAAVIAVAPVFINFAALSTVPGGVVFTSGFLAADLLLFLGAFSFEIFSMVPFEFTRLWSVSPNGILILDDEDTLLYLNPAAESLCQRKATPYEDKILDLLPAFPQDVLSGKKETSASLEEVHEIVPGRLFDVTMLPIVDYAGRLVGKSITLREITAQRRAEAEAQTAKRTLDLMNTITRHDVLNQLTIIEGHLALAGSKCDQVGVKKHIDASYQAASNIQKLMQFARDYQEMRRRTPVWQDLEEKIRSAASTLDLKEARLNVDTKGVDILADLLLEKVLYNLMQNSIVHGGKVQSLAFAVKEEGDGIYVVYTDDGKGISENMRPLLFTKGGGTDSGLGLFLSKEILGHSGMTIIEDGISGQGVRFVIHVPRGSFRYPILVPSMVEPAMRSSSLST
ncbi:MAG: histidine kinase N-terminal 7TM domain-containing protein [Methanomassiliicoccus sp.]|nr:histidine kinase N-terminal 7TM domain-containing protein [Methanomassiliicoccus sp.]